LEAYFDGWLCSGAVRAWTEPAIEILPNSLDKDDPGFSQAIFCTSANTRCEGFGTYLLRHGDFTCIQSEEDDDDAFERKQLVWKLDQYAELKKALNDRAAWPFFEKIRQPLPVARAHARLRRRISSIRIERESDNAYDSREVLVPGKKCSAVLQSNRRDQNVGGRNGYTFRTCGSKNPKSIR